MSEKKTSQLSHTQRMVLWALSVRPQAAKDLALALDVDVTNIRRAIKPLEAKGLLFSDSVTMKLGQITKLYKTHTHHPDPRAEVVGKDNHPAPNLALIVDAINQAGQPLTVQELVEFTGLDSVRVRRSVKRCVQDGSRLRIAKWVYIPGSGYGWSACYCTSKGANAAKPAADTAFARSEWVKRNKALRRIEHQRARVKAGRKSPLYGHVFSQLFSVAGVSPKKAAEHIREAA